MSEFYEVKLTAYKVVVVEVPDDYEPDQDREDLACKLACEQTFSFVSEVETEAEKLTGATEVEEAKRHADEVI
ncbi:MAG TPA: hypothetical protein DD989_23110 [Pseudomonas sp.]|nr:hypothetical protein [Pseudomonas sp.]